MNNIEGDLNFGTGKVVCNKLLKRTTTVIKTLSGVTTLTADELLSGSVSLVSNNVSLVNAILSFPSSADIVSVMGTNAKVGVGFSFIVQVVSNGINTQGVSLTSSNIRIDIPVSKSKKVICVVSNLSPPTVEFF